MKVLCVLGFVLLLMLKIVLLPVRALLGLLDLSLEFVGKIVCRIGEILLQSQILWDDGFRT